MDMRKYQKKFAQESIDGAILSECDEYTLLQELKVTSKLDRIKLLKIILGHYSALHILERDDHTLNLNVVNFIAVKFCNIISCACGYS